MRPRNFPSRIIVRRERARARAAGAVYEPAALPHVDDMRVRLGAAARRGHAVTSNGIFCL